MTDQIQEAEPPHVTDPDERGKSLLMVTTVASTLSHFLIPYALHLRARGWRVDAAANGARADAKIQEAFDTLYELPLSRSILDVPGMLRGFDAVRRVLDSRPEIVHVHTPIAAFVTRLAIRRLPEGHRPAVAYTAHGFHFYRGGSRLSNAVFITAERIAGRWTDRLIVMNDEDEDGARRHRIVPPSRLVRMPGIGLDTAFYDRAALAPDEVAAARAALAVPAGAPLFIAVGELSRRKRMADVISALARVRDPQARLAIAGEGVEKRHLEELISQLGLTGRVMLLGKIADVRPFVASAIGLVLASSREGLPRAIMEALSLEVPVIASTARGNAELVGSDAGFVFQTGDVAALASHMDWLIAHRASAIEMGRIGRVRMVERYDLAKLIQLHDQLYATMRAERARGGPS